MLNYRIRSKQDTVQTQQKNPLNVYHHWIMVSYVTANQFKGNDSLPVIGKQHDRRICVKLSSLDFQNKCCYPTEGSVVARIHKLGKQQRNSRSISATQRSGKLHRKCQSTDKCCLIVSHYITRSASSHALKNNLEAVSG